MRILEISSPSPELRQQDTLTQLESLVKLTETLSPKSPTPSTLSSQLRNCVSQLSQLGPDSLANSVKLQLWKLSYRLWNACVDLSNSSSSSRSGNDHVEFRRAAADLLFIAGDVSGVPSPSLKAASFYYKTGLIYHELKNFEFASNCFEKATDLVSKVEIESISDLAEKRMFLDINIARARTSWEVSDRNLSITLLNRSKKFLFEMAGNYGVLAEQYLAFGKALLAKSEVLEAKEALKLMNEGLELCERGLRVVKKTEETLHLKCLRDKTLRFIAALHLQREEYESVIKCLRVLRDHSGIKSGDAHPSLSVLAMKAWLGLGRSSEAEKELRDMVVNKGIPEGVWVSAVEAYFKAVGVAAIETVKSVFMGLLGRCQVSASAAVRVIYRVIGEGGGGGGEGLRIREIMVEELVTDERVVTLFAGDGAARERTALHAVLWNCAAAHFRSKEYKISANLFEKAMLYEPSGIESRILRAKGYRVLCLCHLALSQLDQAKEYIDEAEKLEPNIACAFLKFKIYLQTNDHTAAITQMKAMMRCTDFTTAYLSLSAHEAVACRALSVAVASLSDLLNFYTSGKQMPIAEIVVFRTILAILTQEPGNELEVLNFMKRAESRISELGPDNFFGKGEVGIRERNWIATIAWNIGTKAGAEKNYELCAEFMHTSADFYSAIMDGEIEGNSAMVCKSIILSVSAMLSSEKQNKVAMLDAQLKKVLELLERAEKLMEALSTSDKLLDCEDNTLDPKLYIAYILSAYELHGRRNDTVSQQQLVKKFANSKACNPKHLLQIGLTASQGPHQNAEVATFTLNTCLSAMLASPLQDYKDVALVIRRLITLAVIYKGDADDEVVYSLYKQAYKIMVGLKEGEYPVTEGKWLATTSWNRAALPVRLGQVGGAKKWMNMGLELAKKVPGLETYKACMEDYITGFEKRLPEND
ncbi:TPR repeat-containing protein ZIP4 [Silene latifolia]|uniref:TPR repeat-containing protein ZIP4 n=1 Tax=Silene latifolia TaxID=37657 RepID=UPI003D785E43